jgi:hypothetical protein
MFGLDVFSFVVGATLAGVPFLIREWIRHCFATDRDRQAQRDHIHRETLREIPLRSEELFEAVANLEWSPVPENTEALRSYYKSVHGVTRLMHGVDDDELRELLKRFLDACRNAVAEDMELSRNETPETPSENYYALYDQLVERCGELLRKL